MSPHAPLRRGLVGTLAAGLVATPLALLGASPAQAASTGLVISEVYGGGGNSGATYTHDYVELHNRSSAPISLSGKSLQYRSASSTSAPSGSNLYALPAVDVAPGDYFVVRGAGSASTPANVPNVDATASFDMSGSNGQIFLADTTTGLIPTASENGNVSQANIIDFVGYGSANRFEGAAAAAPSNSTVISRYASNADNDNNQNDFFVTDATFPPSPGTGTTRTPGTTNPPAPGTTRTIPEIQGTGAASPHVGTAVVTSGVVTAAYPAGGFFGFYLQTPGTGGPTDPASRTASDAVFVRQTSAAGAVTVQPGQTVQVTGTVREFAGQTQVEVTRAADIARIADAAPVTATTTATWPATDELKERLEGMVYRPQGPFTISNNFATNQFGELGLAAGTTPLIQPTEVARPGSPEAAAQAADNAARAIVLDDGSSAEFTRQGETAAACGSRPIPCLLNGDLTPPYISTTAPLRIGATGTFTEDVILTQGGNPNAPTYRVQPLQTVVGDGSGAAPISVENTRTDTPVESLVDPDGTADVKIAGFNVLNYFTTLGTESSTCTPFRDRTDNGNNVSGGCQQRGAWDAQDFARQESKIVDAINALDADVVGLVEIENSAALGETVDEATSTLVAALNAEAGPGTWAVNPSSAELPPANQLDVITNAIIYKPAAVTRVGESRALGDQSGNGQAFVNAREPLAQAFAPVGGGEPFLVVVNHFKSKGSAGPFPGDADQNDGQGRSNESRVRQATALVEWVPTIQGDVDDVFLLGDFNSYGEEDPMQVLYDAEAGYTNLAAQGDYSYSFGGLSGSLDHALANASALERVTGADVWNINGNEPIALEYSRFNYHATDFHAPGPFRSSDHDPIVVGLTSGAAPVDPVVDLNILGFNDFHGRINNSVGSDRVTQTGTAQFAGTIEQLRAAAGEERTLLLGNGDLYGASEFNSAANDDEPTFEVMGALDLAGSSVGNHEFDLGWADLRDRVIGTDAAPGLAPYDYLGANVYAKGTQNPVLPEYALYEVDGVTVAAVGAVTEETPNLVSPDAVAELDFGNAKDAINRVATELKDGDPSNGEADVVVALIHAGANTLPANATYADALRVGGREFNEMAQLNDEVDAVFNGHTHQAYAFSQPKPGTTGGTRPIVQAGQYGERVGQVTLTFDRASGEVTSHTQRVVSRITTPRAELVQTYPRVAAVQRIVDQAIRDAAVVGNVPVGSIARDITTAYNGSSRDDRTSESTLGELVGNALRDGLPETAGEADLGIVNPGGLRAELLFAGDTSSNPRNTDGVVTYAEANGVLPFVNNVSLVDLTGAQLRQVLEQQFPQGTRGFLHLGLSDNVNVTIDRAAPAGERITSVRIDGEPLDPAATYTVSTFSFLAAGGDNFTAFRSGTSRDTGLIDRDLWISYLQDRSLAGPNNADAAPIRPDFARQQVDETGLPELIVGGEPTTFTLSRLDLTSLGSPTNTTLTARVADTAVGSFPVTAGTAQVELTVPVGVQGDRVTLTAQPSGTTVVVPFQATDAPQPPTPSPVATTVTGSAEATPAGQPATVRVTVTPQSGTGTPTGIVRLSDRTGLVGEATLAQGAGTISVPASRLQPGSNVFALSYGGDGTYAASTGSVTVTVTKAAATVRAAAVTVDAGEPATLDVVVSGDAETGSSPSGTVEVRDGSAVVATARIVDGRGTATVPASALRTGSNTLTLSYSGDDVFAPADGSTTVTVTADLAESTVALTVSPRVAVVGKDPIRYTVAATAGGVTPTGTVELVHDGEVVRTGTLENGRVEFRSDPSTTVGEYRMTARYLGDDATTPGTASVTVEVVKQRPGATLTAPARAPRGSSQTVLFELDTVGVPATGQVELTFQGRTVTRWLRDGSVSLSVGPLRGQTRIEAQYLGNDRLEAVKRMTIIKIGRG